LRPFGLIRLVVLLAVVGASGLVPATPTRSQAGEEDQALLRELADRILHGSSGGIQTNLALLPGALPIGLPLGIVVPPGGRLLGSLVRTSQASGTTVTIVLEAPGAPADARAGLEATFTSQGWAAPRPNGFPFPQTSSPPSGFLPAEDASPASPPAVTTVTLCQENGDSLGIATQATDTSTAWLSLSIARPNDTGVGICTPPREAPSFAPPSFPSMATRSPGADLIPAMRAPEGVHLQPGPGVVIGGMRTYGNEANAWTTLSTTVLEAHFASQLEAAGWSRIAGAGADRVAGSVWRVPSDEEWLGLLLITAPVDDRRTLLLRVDGIQNDQESEAFLTGPRAIGLPAPPIPFQLPVATDNGLVRELTEHLLGASTSVPFQMTLQQARIDLAAIPPELPAALPLPTGGWLLGGVVRQSDNGTSVQVHLDAPGAPADLVRFFADAFTAQGWYPQRLYTRLANTSVFGTDTGQRAATFCKAGTGTSLSVSATPQEDGSNQVQVGASISPPQRAERSAFWECDRPSEGMRFTYPRVEVPTVLAPVGVEVIGTSSGYYGDLGMAWQGVARTSMSSTALADYFGTGLGEAGWRLLSTAGDGPIGASLWTVPGEGDWHGLLLVHEMPGEGRHGLILNVTPAVISRR
jgi:hypothetical protein